MKMKYFIVFLALVCIVGTPLFASAQASIPAPGETVLARGPQGVIGLVNTITNWLFSLLLVVAVVFILLAAFKYLTSGGGEEVGAAHKMILYAAVAIAVAFLAKGIVFVVAQLVTTGGGSYNGNGSNLQIKYQTDDFGVRVNL